MARRFFVCFLIGAVIAWAPVSSVLAEDQIIKPKVTAWASGKGFVHLEGKGEALLLSAGDGAILVRNVHVTKIEIKGAGKLIPLPKEKALLIVDLKGLVRVAGKVLSITSHGGPVELKTHGHGALWLKGKGLFKIGEHPVHEWPDEVKTFKY